MAELERELAELLDQAPLLPEDDDEGSGVDFVPPPNLAPRPESSRPPPAGDAETSAAAEPPTSPEEPPAEALAPAPVAVAPMAAVPVAVVPVAVAASEVQKPRALAAADPAAGAGEGESIRAVPATGKGTRALVTTLVVAAVLVVGKLLTWPSETHQVRQSNSPASARLRPDAALPARAPAAPAVPAVPAVPAAPAVPAPSIAPSGEAPATAHIADAAGSNTAPAFSVVDMLSALAPAAIEAGRCRHTGAPTGRAYVRVNIAAGGSIESVFPGHAYKDSETADCIERKIRAAELPPFSGAGGSVVLAVDLR